MFVYLVYKKYIVEFLCSHFIRPAPHPPNRIGTPHSPFLPCSLFRPSPQPGRQVRPHFPFWPPTGNPPFRFRNRTGRATGGSPSGERKLLDGDHVEDRTLGTATYLLVKRYFGLLVAQRGEDILQRNHLHIPAIVASARLVVGRGRDKRLPDSGASSRSESPLRSPR